ncbi:CbtA family protein [Solwaraspora sp. WMMB335]|uniref:CbtA family protein n=1 Tax=Solwaraspora sp. WMMB335 TaxID=3404118 RepID=UPI003B95C679
MNPAWSAAATAVAGYALLLAFWPATGVAVPADVPASLLWEFRLASLGQLAVLWTVLGVVLGLLLTPVRAAVRPAVAPA